MPLDLETPFTPKGDQPKAIAQLIEGINKGHKHQTLLGVTGSGKLLLWLLLLIKSRNLL